jgi:uncharacterized protein YrrD
LGKRIDALDGHIGSVRDLFFDEQTWQVRYLVVDTGKWLPGREVLIIPEAIAKPWHETGDLPLNLTKEQIQTSPEIDAEQPMSRATEELLYRHFQWMPYWDMAAAPVPSAPAPDTGSKAESLNEVGLRSANELGGYHVQATDGEVGRLDDFLLHDDCDRILFLVIAVKGLFFGKEVLAAPRLVSRVDRAGSAVCLDATKQSIKSAQEYTKTA